MRCINSSTLGNSSVLSSAMVLSSGLYCTAAGAFGAALHRLLTLPIIGSTPHKWNVFSIFIYGEISIARHSKMT
jgi:hypothetical protein